MAEGTRLPHDPSRTVGRWAMSMANRLFKIEEAFTTMGEARYIGTDLHGNEVRTACVTVLSETDHNVLEERCSGKSRPQ